MRVAFLGQDLIMFSKVAAVARDLGCELVGDQTGADLVFVDLNSGAGGIAEVKAAAQSGAEVVGFCGHEAKEVRQAAMAAGATLCVTNGTLTQAARRLIAERMESVR
jgi:AmiR/NasT family two-component response regulator